MENFKEILDNLKNLFRGKEDDLGKKGEELAVKYLKNSGFEIVERRFRASRGEIDIVAKEKDTLVFVEVKTRKSNEFGSPLEAVDERKKAQIRKIAGIYISKKYKKFIPCRFDVIGIKLKNKDYDISHIRNAF
ncbi:MAG: YraN family protein [Candidatus Aminicenantia bacterium]